jgi:hypothetical protein
MSTSDTTVGRLKLVHPDLGHDGGSGLHTKVRTAWTKLSDNINSRYGQAAALADAASVDFDHNFKADFGELQILLYTYDGSGNLTRINSGSSPAITAFTIEATPSFENTQVRVTNNSGGPVDLAAVIVHNGGGAAGGGGGGGSFNWREPPTGDAPPVRESQDGELIYSYEPGQDNRLVAYLKVPDGHLSGSQLNMKLGYFTPSTANNVLWRTTTTLIRKGVDAISSTTNQHISTNTAQTNVSPANAFREAAADLTDGSGQINSVTVNPGDLLRIELRRGTDTDTANVKLIPSSTEVE